MMREGPVIMMHKLMDHLTTNLMHRGRPGNTFNCTRRQDNNNCKNITLDIDASEVIANKADTQWTYKGNKGYMPMVGHSPNRTNCCHRL